MAVASLQALRQGEGEGIAPALPVLQAATSMLPDGENAETPSIDLDAIDSRYHLRRCVCRACSTDRQATEGAAATTLSNTATAAPAAAASLQTLANYLRVGYWQAAGSVPRLYNLSRSGINPNAGEIRFNLSGWNFDTDSDGVADGDTDGLTAERRDLAREVLKLYQATLGIRFVETTATDTSVDIFFTDNRTKKAYAYSAGNSYSNGIDYSVINVSTDWYSGLSGFNTYTVQTFFHEIGHALGLGHQGRYNGTGSYATDAQFANDSWQASMMSYFSQTQNPTTGASYAFLQTPMSVDWLSLDNIYRASGYGIANAFTGDTVYGVGTTISAAVSRIWNEFSTYAGTTAYTIVDASGYDTLDASNFSADQLINLAPSQAASTTPSRSNIGGKIGNLTIAVGTILEAAIGGGGNDRFFGNDAANTFSGGGGNDSFFDSLGSDVYFGDAGSDALFFSESIGLLRYQLSGDSLLFSRSSGSADVDQVWRGLETLSFNSVVYTYDQLVQSLSLSPLATVTIASVNGLPSGSATNATSLSFSGTLSFGLSSNQSIAIYRDGLQVGTAAPTTPTATSWTFALQVTAGTNVWSYTARVVEAGSGRLGRLSNPFSLTVDTTAPTAPTLTLASDTGSSGTDRLTNNGNITVGGLETGGSWQYSINSGASWSAALGATTTTFSVAAGIYTTGQVQVRQSDAAGNSSGVNTTFQAFTVDTTAPATTASITSITDNVGLLQGSLAEGGFTDDTTPTFTGTLSAALASGESLRLFNGDTLLGSASVINPTWSFTPSTLLNGFYATAARVADAAGNLGAARAVQRFSLDATANQVIGDANANILSATSAQDVLTGLAGADTFSFVSLARSTLARFDRITDFVIGTDFLDGPTAVASANINKLGAVFALDATSIGNVLTNTAFLANTAATFSFADPSGLTRSFIALNDATGGYAAISDAIVEITGYSGNLNNLMVI